MLFYTVGQSWIFLAMLYMGIAIGVWLDVVIFFRRLFVAGPVLSVTLDAIFCVGAFCAIFAMLLFANGGELRLYALLGALCGVVIYGGTGGPLLRFLGKHIGRWLQKNARIILKSSIMQKILK